MKTLRCLVATLIWCLAATCAAGPAQDAATYASAVAKINDAHVRQPGRNKESDLAKQLPASAKSALKSALAAKPSPDLGPALLRCGEAALDLSLEDDFKAVREKLAAVSPAEASKLGSAVFRPRFIVRGIGDFKEGYLEAFADVCDGILAAYDEVFEFAEFSKVPGKKLRFRVHLEPEIKNPPHFAPQFPWHSEVDFPVADGAQFSSPTARGQFLFYGLCHELGHVVAMWGDLKNMEDKHAWAHYTGVVIVEHLAESSQDKPWMASLKDVRWRSLKIERDLPDNKTIPSTVSVGGVMSLLLALHDSAGPKAIGAALNQLDAQKRCRRINHVRYYSFADFRKALLAAAPEKKSDIARIFRQP